MRAFTNRSTPAAPRRAWPTRSWRRAGRGARAVFDVDPDRARFDHGGHRLSDGGRVARVAALDIHAQGDAEPPSRFRDGRHQQRHGQEVSVRIAVGPGHAGALVASAFAPRLSIRRALPASQALGSTSRPSSCSRRNTTALWRVRDHRASPTARTSRILRILRVRRPEVLGRIGAPRPPGLGAPEQVRGRRPRARGAASRPGAARRRWPEGVGLAQRAQRDVLRRPLADAADGAQAGDRLLDGPERAEEVGVGDRRLGERHERRAPRRGHAERGRGRPRRRAPARGTRATAPDARDRGRQGLAAQRDEPAREPRAAATTSPAGRGSRAPPARSRPSRRARAGPGRRATSGARNGSRERWAPIVSMSAPTSNTRRTRATIAGEGAHAGEADRRRQVVPRRLVPDLDRAETAVVGHGAPIDARPPTCSTPSMARASR